MPECQRCGVEKQQCEFFKDISRPSGYHCYCKICFSASNRITKKNWLNKNRETERIKARARRLRRKKERNAYNRIWRKNNPQRVKIMREKTMAKHGDKYRARHRDYMKEFAGYFRRVKNQAKNRGLEFSLTEEQVFAMRSSPCYYCGSSTGRTGMDRVNNDWGYSFGNSVPACYPCNRAKGKMTIEVFLALCRNIVKNMENKNHDYKDRSPHGDAPSKLFSRTDRQESFAPVCSQA